MNSGKRWQKGKVSKERLAIKLALKEKTQMREAENTKKETHQRK